MSREEFLKILNMQLQGEIPSNEISQHLAYYHNFIEQKIRQGQTESDILEGLGDPRLIAKTLIDTEDVPNVRGFRQNYAYSAEEAKDQTAQKEKPPEDSSRKDPLQEGEGSQWEAFQWENFQEDLGQKAPQRESFHKEASRQESFHKESFHKEPVHKESSQQEPFHKESSQQESFQQESFQQESFQQESFQQEPPRRESVRWLDTSTWYGKLAVIAAVVFLFILLFLIIGALLPVAAILLMIGLIFSWINRRR